MNIKYVHPRIRHEKINPTVQNKIWKNKSFKPSVFKAHLSLINPFQSGEIIRTTKIYQQWKIKIYFWYILLYIAIIMRSFLLPWLIGDKINGCWVCILFRLDLTDDELEHWNQRILSKAMKFLNLNL